MALQLKQSRNRTWKFTAAKGAVVVGAAYLILSTFPHLRKSVFELISGTKKKESSEDANKDPKEYDDNTPIELEDKESPKSLDESAVNITQSQVDIAEWSQADLKSWLGEKEINPPPNASHDNLVSLVKSIQETSNEL
ncbi:uncharacterized protein CANTADRAFT_244198 [Suhomyces tanzawaensis NRRL Y-17324]|uniref:Uncharacterized protein n=1 Tax=Suhomyces tanzawaensis NRRL Y-17324 TaxID=984487 RepID=A0A1E4SHQ3_9ASCO|nr:uncharacterized protein CANTADRAFT_244198 [Suhomyces tanzawaensis NRRL Y-17324]ODV79044.1 hypothetical protein CANTADRAFT_244198 [Suhomyces tanzawaensis NRRL Y-17324]